MRLNGAIVLLAVLAATSAYPSNADNWQKPGEIIAPTRNWQTPGQIKAPAGNWQTPGAVQAPKTTLQKPGEIQKVAPIAVKDSGCQHRLSIGSDVLFDFNKSDINPKGEKSLQALGAMVARYGVHPIKVEGHTDSVGSDTYNQKLSESRAASIKSWLVAHQYINESAETLGYGKRKPIAANTLNGKDNPAGRQKNRRVEIVIDTCK